MADRHASARTATHAARLGRLTDGVPDHAPIQREGILRRVVGLTLEAAGMELPVGASCRVAARGGWVDAEVVGFSGDRTFLMPSAEVHGLLPNARVVPTAGEGTVPVGEGLLGRVIDGEGTPLDGRPMPRLNADVPLSGRPINPLEREPI